MLEAVIMLLLMYAVYKFKIKMMETFEIALIYQKELLQKLVPPFRSLRVTLAVFVFDFGVCFTCIECDISGT